MDNSKSVLYQKFLEGSGTIGKEIMQHMADLESQNRNLLQKTAGHEELLQLTDSLPQLVWKTDKDGNNTFTSRRWVELTGVDPDEEGAFQRITHPEDYEKIMKTWIESISSGKPFKAEVRIKNKRGDYIWYYVHSESRRDATGIVEWIGAFTDINDQKNIEKELKRFKHMADNASDAFVLMREDATFEFLNKRAIEAWGYNQDEAENLSVYDISPMMTEKRYAEIFRLVQIKPAMSKFEGIHLRKDGSTFPVEVNASKLILDGKPYLFAIARDVSENKKILEKLRESEESFRLLADASPVLVWTSGTDKLRTFFNKGWLEFTGRTMEEEYGNGWTEGVHPDDHDRCVGIYATNFDKRKEFYLEYRLKNKDGEYRWILGHGVPRYSNGQFQGFIGACMDINEQKMFSEELEKNVALRTQELKQSNEELLKTNEQLEQFAYVSSHDLQEPLRKIQIYSQILAEKIADNLEAQTYLNRITASSARMTELIKDILNYSKLSKSEQFVKVGLNEILQRVITDFELLITQKNAVIKSDELPAVKAIPTQINQLFYNLISNSLKFTETNPVIEIRSKVLSKPEVKEIPQLNPETTYLKLVFSDNGIGFKKEYSDKIFVIFQRLNDRQTFGGTGIGLAITKKVIENHDGFIFAASEFGHGATFTIYLPYRK